MLAGHNSLIKVNDLEWLDFNPTALRTAKTLQSFGCSECNRVKQIKHS